MSALTVVTYHYVRDLSRTRYPGLKACTVGDFEGQLDYIRRYYRVVGARDVVAAARGERTLGANACLLTFDDGLLDHYTTVFPCLIERGLTASFYPPVATVEGRRVLDVHKIQIILAAARDVGKLARQILDMMEEYRRGWELPAAESFYREHAQPYMFDPPEVGFVKRVLQRVLPEPVRAAITARLFEEYVGDPEEVVVKELYMDLPQLRAMAWHGMEVGGHGARHVWLDALPPAEQEREIALTVEFLGRVYLRPPQDWVMCYPFGSYNNDTLAMLRAAGCALGLTSRQGLANLSTPLELLRLDVTDLPMRGDAPLSEWTARVLAAETPHG